jgi:hypothetical protein
MTPSRSHDQPRDEGCGLYPGRSVGDRAESYLRKHGTGGTGEIAKALGVEWLTAYSALRQQTTRFKREGEGKEAKWSLVTDADPLADLTTRACAVIAAEAEAQGLSARELGRRAGVTQATTSRVITGKVIEMEFGHVARLLAGLGKSLAWLDERMKA